MKIFIPIEPHKTAHVQLRDSIREVASQRPIEVTNVVLEDLLANSDLNSLAIQLIIGYQYRGAKRQAAAAARAEAGDWSLASLLYWAAAEFALVEKRTADAKLFYEKAAELKLKWVQQIYAEDESTMKFVRMCAEASKEVPPKSSMPPELDLSLRWLCYKYGNCLGAISGYRLAMKYTRIANCSEQAFELLYAGLERFKERSDYHETRELLAVATMQEEVRHSADLRALSVSIHPLVEPGSRLAQALDKLEDTSKKPLQAQFGSKEVSAAIQKQLR